MHYNFDTIVDRKNTNSIKYDFMEEFHKPADCLSMWVADMDFQSPIEVREALTKVVEQGIYGYTDMKEDYFGRQHRKKSFRATRKTFCAMCRFIR